MLTAREVLQRIEAAKQPLCVGVDLGAAESGIVVLDLDGAVLHQEKVGYRVVKKTDNSLTRRRFRVATGLMEVIQEFPGTVALHQYGLYAQKGSMEMWGAFLHAFWLVYEGTPIILPAVVSNDMVLKRGSKTRYERIKALGYDFDSRVVADAFVAAEWLRRFTINYHPQESDHGS